MFPNYNSPFHWVDRDTAGHDLLQLYYHAPPSIAGRALQLLKAIRSTAIIDDLQAIVLNDTWGSWHRVHALRAISATGIDQPYPQLKPVFLKQLQGVERYWRANRNPNTTLNSMMYPLVDEFFGLIDKSPSNASWFYDVIDNYPDPEIAMLYLSNLVHYSMSEESQITIRQRLLTLMQTHPDLLNLGIIDSLFSNDDEISIWLNTRLDAIAEMFNKENMKQYAFIVAYWEELFAVVKKRLPEIEEIVEERQRRVEQDFARRQHPELDSIPLYLKLNNLYQEAESGNKTAYRKLRSLASRYKGEIPIRAVAVHFLCRLHGQYNTMPALQRWMTYAHDLWGEHAEFSPIRYEAGEFLSTRPSPQVWRVLVDSYFHHVPNELSNFLDDWIAHVTDVLSGTESPQSVTTWEVSRRPWFTALADYDENMIDD